MTMTTVLDASAAITAVLGNSAQSERMQGIISSSRIVVAPTLYITETANALWKYADAGHFSQAEMVLALHRCESLITRFTQDEEVINAAFIDACSAKHPVYDMIYVSVARDEAGTLCTLDSRLAKIAQSFGIPVFS
ncbi:MAG: type II toxin-antitoxin system VapC family toxin [Propionibacteriaceae bacterium]|jgi:predicted nucleic acid-binding protein|nr:type II toxin-antitoxin system VapC family toxin [Propionibacteriaceae bacterium]